MAVEREVKLRFASADEARQRILAAVEATPLHGRRLQEDCLLDTADRQLAARGATVRVRHESGKSLLTFKGPVQGGVLKTREERETVVADGEVLLSVFAEVGLQVWFRYEKYREEFAAGEVVIAVDETPIGVFVEIEGSEDHIHQTAAALGCGRGDYVTASYRALYVEDCAAEGRQPTDMLFE